MALIEAFNQDARGAFFSLIRNGLHQELRDFLKEKPEAVDWKDSVGRPALVVAIHTEIFSALLDHNADPNKSNGVGMDALKSALLGRHQKHLIEDRVITMLLNAGARRDAPNREGVTADHMAHQFGDTAAQKLFREHDLRLARHQEKQQNFLASPGNT